MRGKRIKLTEHMIAVFAAAATGQNAPAAPFVPETYLKLPYRRSPGGDASAALFAKGLLAPCGRARTEKKGPAQSVHGAPRQFAVLSTKLLQ